MARRPLAGRPGPAPVRLTVPRSIGERHALLLVGGHIADRESPAETLLRSDNAAERNAPPGGLAEGTLDPAPHQLKLDAQARLTQLLRRGHGVGAIFSAERDDLDLSSSACR